MVDFANWSTDSISDFLQKNLKKFSFCSKKQALFCIFPESFWMWRQNGDMNLSKNFDTLSQMGWYPVAPSLKLLVRIFRSFLRKYL